MSDAERTVVKTYVPRYQKEAWQRDAESMEMSQSEFVRTMVQAGRSDFDLGADEGSSPDATPGGDALESMVRTVLADGGRSWDVLVEELTAELEETLDFLQASGDVRFSPGEGYVLTEEP